MHVLILHEDDVFRARATAALAACGHDTIECSSVGCAQRALSTQSVDLMIMDLSAQNESTLPIARLAAIVTPGVDVILVTRSTVGPYGELHNGLHNIRWTLRHPVRFSDIAALADYSAHLRKRSENQTTEQPDWMDLVG